MGGALFRLLLIGYKAQSHAEEEMRLKLCLQPAFLHGFSG